ncbi:MAG TPA: cupin domain-containing protein [Oceanipulchritudo sp.]|nr:cupin domain-containing protein [Oceanipulchritudo sp.]
MHTHKTEIPLRINLPGAVARQQTGFGDATGYGPIAGEFFAMAKGTDLAPLLKGLENDLCQSPHWGYQLKGEVIVTYSDGKEETVSEGDLFYWPPGHTVRVSEDAEIILFSPQNEHCSVVDHIKSQLTG